MKETEEDETFKFLSSAEYLSYKPKKRLVFNNNINEDKYIKKI